MGLACWLVIPHKETKFALAPPAPKKRETMGAPHMVMALISLWIGFLEWGSARRLYNFAARKLCHAGCGVGFMFLDVALPECRVFVWAVAASSIALTWDLLPLPPFRFASPRDVGVTVYLGLVSGWFYLRLPPSTLAPLYFADPAGAVVGKWCSRNLPRNPRAYGQKTLCGSLAVLLVTFATVTYPCSLAARGTIAVCAAAAEAVGGAYDNLAIAAVVLVGWRSTM